MNQKVYKISLVKSKRNSELKEGTKPTVGGCQESENFQLSRFDSLEKKKRGGENGQESIRALGTQ